MKLSKILFTGLVLSSAAGFAELRDLDKLLLCSTEAASKLVEKSAISHENIKEIKIDYASEDSLTQVLVDGTLQYEATIILKTGGVPQKMIIKLNEDCTEVSENQENDVAAKNRDLQYLSILLVNSSEIGLYVPAKEGKTEKLINEDTKKQVMLKELLSSTDSDATLRFNLFNLENSCKFKEKTKGKGKSLVRETYNCSLKLFTTNNRVDGDGSGLEISYEVVEKTVKSEGLSKLQEIVIKSNKAILDTLE